MSTFKLKSKKTNFLPSFQTVNGSHKKFIDKFKIQKKSLPEKKKKLDEMKRKMVKLMNKSSSKYTSSDIHKKSELKYSIKKLEEEVYNIENDVTELEYYSNTSNLLMDYYDIVEKYDDKDEVNIEETEMTETEIEPVVIKKVDSFDKLNKLNKLQQKNSKKLKKKKTIVRFSRKKKVKNGKDIMLYLNNTKNKIEELDDTDTDRATLLDDFLTITDGEYISSTFGKYNPIKMCLNCDVEKTLMQSEGFYVCRKCGSVENVIVESERPSYKDPIPEKSGYPYKRMNHFNECVSQFQAKESTEIPEHVYKKIYVELKKKRITNYEGLTYNNMKLILKTLRLHKYYEHIYHIISKINKLPPPTISREMEENLRHKFKQMQKPFEKYRPKDRSNFLSYSYVLHKLCQLLELDQIIECFTLLKDRGKLRQQDYIWKKICKDCKWKFYPSI